MRIKVQQSKNFFWFQSEFIKFKYLYFGWMYSIGLFGFWLTISCIKCLPGGELLNHKITHTIRTNLGVKDA